MRSLRVLLSTILGATLLLTASTSGVLAACDPQRPFQTQITQYGMYSEVSAGFNAFEQIWATVDNSQLPFFEGTGAQTAWIILYDTNPAKLGANFSVGVRWRPGQGGISATQIVVRITDEYNTGYFTTGGAAGRVMTTVANIPGSDASLQLHMNAEGTGGSAGDEHYRLYVNGKEIYDNRALSHEFSGAEDFDRAWFIVEKKNNGDQVNGVTSNWFGWESVAYDTVVGYDPTFNWETVTKSDNDGTLNEVGNNLSVRDTNC